MIDALPLLLGPEGYQISRSVRLRSSASAYFQRTPSSAGDRQKFTISFWMKRGTIGTLDLFTGNNANGFLAGFRSDNTLYLYDAGAGSGGLQLWSARVFRDPSAWYHLVIAVDTTQATDSNRLKVYVNGAQETLSAWTVGAGASRYPSLNANFDWNNTNSHEIGYALNYGYFDGYLTEFNNVSGQQLDPSSFGETNPVTGVWQPKKYTGTYGTNGFYLNFSDNSAATAAAIGKDYSGNGNNWTPNNISVTAGVTYDSMLDVPTPWADGGNGRGNYCVLNPLQKVSGYAPANGNLRSVMNATGAIFASIGVTTGKWYWENIYEVAPNGNLEYGVSLGTVSTSSQPGNVSGSWAYSPFNGSIYSQSSTAIATVASASLNDVIGCALDVDAGTLAIYKNNTLLYTISSISGGALFPVIGGSSSINAQTSVNFGQQPFAYTPPSGFKALNTGNLPTPTILKGNQYFDATLWTGDNTARNITNSGAMQPDLVWVKSRSTAGTSHVLIDAVRGANLALQSDLTNAEATFANSVTGFNSDGFALGTSNQVNLSPRTYVGWQWKEGATQGFDIVTYTGNGTAGRTVSHSLGVAPKMIIAKKRSTATSSAWAVGFSEIGWTKYLLLQTTGAAATDANVWNSAPTSSVFYLGTDVWNNANGETHVAYLFSEVAGFSKFGSYTGNGSADGPFVFCGFRPRWIMFKRTDATSNWVIVDTARSTYNETTVGIVPNSSSAETTGVGIYDVLSNGFKCRNVIANEANVSGGTYIFAAFAESPFKNALAR